MTPVVEILSNYAANGFLSNIETSAGEGSPARMYHLCCNTNVLLTKDCHVFIKHNDKVFILLLTEVVCEMLSNNSHKRNQPFSSPTSTLSTQLGC
jgi:hypothetical protein